VDRKDSESFWQLEFEDQVRGAILIVVCKLYAFWLNKHDNDLCSV